MSSLTRIVPWSQQLVDEVLRPGDLAVDLTAGRGRDTLSLAKAVGGQGQVVAFDLQAVALEQTAELLRQHDFVVHYWPADQVVPKQSGVFLVQACHSRLDQLLLHPARAIVANLGYLPGGDTALITQPASTVAALQKSLALLLSGGRLAVTVYPAHPGGGAEGEAVNDFLCALPLFQWQVLSVAVANCAKAPRLLVAERIS